jgi:outer membrane protein
MKEYTEAERSEAKYKAQSERKGRQLDAEIKRFKQDANFQSQAQKRSGLGTNKGA